MANNSLRLQIGELGESVACLDSENQELLRESKSLKEQHRCLQGTAGYFKTNVEQLQKTVEDIRERMDCASKVIQQLELQNKSLVKANDELNKEMHQVTSQVTFFKDYEAAQENDLDQMRNLSPEVKKNLRTLEDKLAETEHGYHVEKSHSSQLREKVTSLLKLRENQRKDIKDLQQQLETSVQRATFLRLDQENRVQMGSLTHEVGEARNRSKTRKVLRWLWMATQILMMMLGFGCCLLLGLVFAYTDIFNQEFIPETFLAFPSEQNIVQSFSPYLDWRNNGLLPF